MFYLRSIENNNSIIFITNCNKLFVKNDNIILQIKGYEMNEEDK